MYPSPEHYLVRPGTKDGNPGPVVPLIAVDQLPDWMQLMGVPRELDIKQITGLTNLGIIDKDDDDIYEVHLHSDKIRSILEETEGAVSSSSPARQARAKNTDIDESASPEAKNKTETSKEDVQVTTNSPLLPGQYLTAQYQISPSSQGKQDGNGSEPGTTNSPSPASVHEDSTARPQKQQDPVHPGLGASRHNTIDNTVDNTVAVPAGRDDKPIRPHMTQAMRDKPHPTAIQRINTKGKSRAVKSNKAVCRHWCHHGTCMWGMDCRNQHRMPTTLEGLREIGLKDFPTWYRLLMSGAGGGTPGPAVNPDLDLNNLLGGLGVGNYPGGTTVAPPPHYPTTTTPTLSPLGAYTHHQPLAANHQPVPDLRLVSALLAGSNLSNQQVKEVSDTLLHGSRTQAQPYSSLQHAYANLHTNASVAANAANIRRQAEQQQQQQVGRLSRRGKQQSQQMQQMYMSDLPVATRAARVRTSDLEDIADDDVYEMRPEDGTSRIGRGSDVTGVEDGGQFVADRRDGNGQSPEKAPKAPTPDHEEEFMEL